MTPLLPHDDAARRDRARRRPVRRAAAVALPMRTAGAVPMIHAGLGLGAAALVLTAMTPLALPAVSVAAIGLTAGLAVAVGLVVLRGHAQGPAARSGPSRPG